MHIDLRCLNLEPGATGELEVIAITTEELIDDDTLYMLKQDDETRWELTILNTTIRASLSTGMYVEVFPVPELSNPASHQLAIDDVVVLQGGTPKAGLGWGCQG